jgi:hypothetical protein
MALLADGLKLYIQKNKNILWLVLSIIFFNGLEGLEPSFTPFMGLTLE